MHWYQVATSPKIMGELVEAAFELFPDQLAIFYAVIGRAVVMPRTARDAASRSVPKYEFDVTS